ncbi:MAG: phage tail tape measure protein [Verrucomicrobiales bacterium]
MANSSDILLKILTRYDDKGTKRTLKDLDAIAERANKTGKMLSARLTLPLAGIGLVSLKAAADFDRAFNEVNSLLDVSAEEVERLRSGIREMAKELGTDLTAATQGLYNAISAGVPPDNVLTFMDVASRAAIAGVTDVNTSVDLLTSVLNAYKLDASAAQQVSDQLFATVKSGKTTFPELASAIGLVAPLAASADVELSQLLGSLATLTKQGVATPQAVTQIRAAITSLLAPTESLSAVYAQLGVESGRQLIQQRGLAGALEVVRNAIGSNDSQLRAALGSIESFNGILGLTGESAKTAAEDLDAVTNAAGATDEAFSKIDQGSARALAKMQAAITEIRIGIAESGITDVFERVAELVGDAADGFAELPQPVREAVIELGALVALAGPMLLFAGAGAKAVTTFASLAGGVKKAGAAALVAGPQVAGFTALFSAGFVAGRWLDDALGVSDAIDRIHESMVNAHDDVRESLDEQIKGFRDLARAVTTAKEAEAARNEIVRGRAAVVKALHEALQSGNEELITEYEQQLKWIDRTIAALPQIADRQNEQNIAAREQAELQEQISAALEKIAGTQKELTDEQKANRENLAIEIRLLELRARGDEAGAAALERRVEIQSRAKKLQEEMGASAEDALQTATRMVELEEEIAASKAQQAADEQRRREELTDEQKANRENLAIEIRLLELRARGDEAGAAALERRVEIQSRAKKLQEEMGASAEDALQTATRMVELEEEIAASKAQQAADEQRRREDDSRERQRIAREEIAAQHQINLARVAGNDALADQLENELQIRQGVRNLMEQYGYDERAALDIVKARIAARERETSALEKQKTEIAKQTSELEQLAQAAEAAGAKVSRTQVAGKGIQYTVDGQVVGNQRDGISMIGRTVADQFTSPATPSAPASPTQSAAPRPDAPAASEATESLAADVVAGMSAIASGIDGVNTEFTAWSARVLQAIDDLRTQVKSLRNRA